MDNHHYFEEGNASDSEDTLSLCDLSFPNDNPQDELLCPDNPPPEVEEEEEEDSFNFSTNPNPRSTLSPIDSLLFVEKSIPYRKPSNLQYTKIDEEEEEEEEEHQRSRFSIFRSDSFNRFRSFRGDGVKSQKFIADYYGRSNSVRLANKSDASSTAIGSGSSRKYKALIGLTKFPAKMELSEIRRRQSRLPPAPMFAATTNGIGGKSLWGLVRPLRSRSHIVNALARASLGCIPHV